MQAEAVKEIQGLYGPFTLTERVVQKIWLRQDFDTTALQTVCGQSVQIKDPGRWNLLGGPDFKEARLLLAGQSVVGDVEVHFTTSDWYAHQHEHNPEFNRVVLHVVLYPDRDGARPVKTLSGEEPPVLVLMPQLNRDLEAYATDEALLEMEQVDDLEWVAKFLEATLAERQAIATECARSRWEQKVRFAQTRLNDAGWNAACHQYCLEVLGYARNRAPMTRIALEYSLEQLTRGGITADELFATQVGQWKLSGLRPANHPRKRLEQYVNLLAHNSEWPQQMKKSFQQGRSISASQATRAARKRMVSLQRPEGLRLELFGGVVAEKRFHTMMVDAFLPLATAAGLGDYFGNWLHWWPGDCPDAVGRFLKHAQLVGKQQPLTNGGVQAALALFLSRGA